MYFIDCLYYLLLRAGYKISESADLLVCLYNSVSFCFEKF